MKRILFLCLLLLINTLSACSTQKSLYSPGKENPQAAQINAQLSLVYLQAENTSGAKEKILLAQQQAPRDPIVWYTKGYFLEKTGNIDEAEKAYLKAIQLDRKNGSAHNNYGVFLCRQKRYHEAIQQFLLAAKDTNYLYSANAYENAGICASKIPDANLANIYFQHSAWEHERPAH